MKKKTLIILSAFILTLGLTGCGHETTLKNGEEVVASLNGKKFTAEDLYDKLKSQGGETALVNMIDEYILNKEIKTDEDAETYADSQLESYKTQYKNYGMDFEEALNKSGYANEDEFKDSLIIQYKKKAATESYVEDNLTDAEIDKYYEDNIYGDIEAKHILIAPETKDDMSDEEKEEAEKRAKKEAEKLIKKLDKGAKFEDLAKKYSDDSGTASKGGALTVTYGEVVDEFWNATNKLEDGKYTSEPVKTEYGYHIIYRESQKEKPKLKDVKDTIVSKLVDEKIDEDSTLETQAMVALREKYKMSIKDSEIENDYNAAVKSDLEKDKNATSSTATTKQ